MIPLNPKQCTPKANRHLKISNINLLSLTEYVSSSSPSYCRSLSFVWPTPPPPTTGSETVDRPPAATSLSSSSDDIVWYLSLRPEWCLDRRLLRPGDAPASVSPSAARLPNLFDNTCYPQMPFQSIGGGFGIKYLVQGRETETISLVRI